MKNGRSCVHQVSKKGLLCSWESEMEIESWVAEPERLISSTSLCSWNSNGKQTATTYFKHNKKGVLDRVLLSVNSKGLIFLQRGGEEEVEGIAQHTQTWMHCTHFSTVKFTPMNHLLITLDCLHYPLFDFDTEKYGLQIPDQGLVNHFLMISNVIFINVKVK